MIILKNFKSNLCTIQIELFPHFFVVIWLNPLGIPSKVPFYVRENA